MKGNNIILMCNFMRYINHIYKYFVREDALTVDQTNSNFTHHFFFYFLSKKIYVLRHS